MKAFPKISHLLIAVTALVAVTAGVILSNPEPAMDQDAALIAQRAIFTAPDGERFSVDSWAGQYRIVNFWATWCPPCLEEIPLFIRLQERFVDNNVTFIGIAVDKVDLVRSFVEANGVNYPILVGSGDALEVSKIMGNYRAGLPYTVFLDPNGVILERHFGVVPESKIAEFVSKIPK